MPNNEWDFDSAFSTVSGVIPTLLLALVLERQLLAAATTQARATRAAVERRSRWARVLLIVRSPTSRLTIEAMQPVNMIRLAVIAEMLALFAVAMPDAWKDPPIGRFLTYAALFFVGWTVLTLLNLVLVGLNAVVAAVGVGASRAEGGSSVEEHPTTSSSEGTQQANQQ
jgi:hypothetical protein